MKILKILALCFLVVVVWACASDDNNIITIEVRDVAEVAAENDAEIREFLQTHFYNYEEFQTPPADFDFKIVFDTISGVNASKTPLLDQVTTQVVDIDDEGTIVPHNLYVLTVREGLGEESTRRTDSTLVSYRGTLLDGTTFDQRELPVWFDLIGNPFSGVGGVVRGFAEGVSTLSPGTFSENPDGSIAYEDFGIGAVFMPSGLGYFSGPPTGIPLYASLTFTYDLYVVNEADHDNDGIPSYLEDVDMDNDFFNDNTDEDTFPNYVDADDDGDTILTRDEIEFDGEGNVIFTDCDNDGTPDYLDFDICPEG